MIKLTVLYGHPVDVAAFEHYYANTHLPLAARSGVPRVELAKAIGAPMAGSRPIAGLPTSTSTAWGKCQEIMARPEAQAMAADVANFARGGATLEIES